MGFKEGGEGKALAEVLGVFVGGEAGAIGGDFEEDAAWFAEVDGVEVVTVDDGGYTGSYLGEVGSPLGMFFVGGGAEGDVVDASDGGEATGHVGSNVYVDVGSGAARAYFKDGDRGLLLGEVGSCLMETECFCE